MTDSLSQVLVIGVDAGGTRVRARAAEARSGAVVGEGTGGPGNALSVERDALTRHLATALAGAVPAGLGGSVAAVVGGFAGGAVDGGSGRGLELAVRCLGDALSAVGASPAALEVYGDVDVAFASGRGVPADGLVVIAGTGAVAARVAGRRAVRTADGDGWLLGDAGSGFWLGREALTAVLRAFDGRGPGTALVEPLLAHCLGYEEGPPESWAGRRALRERLIAYAFTGHPVRLAALSPFVAAAGAAGDEVAGALLDRAADQLAATVRALAPRPGEPLVTTGGLLGPHGPLLERLAARTGELGLRPEPVPDGTAGAVELARLLT
ncbi:N-acetylglucosamine kinase [Streptomyces formicae]|uniref:ATPase n=1 Tax=Streptomyces formicae TaxID=1616117 RepID=A0ABY3WV50_9ACTN|nr:BadF/BadG/BcrA/BcrD ATPase family protein [Streptomyces formicae]UNM14405.1 ATPase [Streptomyces formicae]